MVTTHGLGRIGHSSFTKSCSGTAGRCDYGKDPGGAWTRSMVDFYLAGVVDAFAKARRTRAPTPTRTPTPLTLTLGPDP